MKKSLTKYETLSKVLVPYCCLYHTKVKRKGYIVNIVVSSTLQVVVAFGFYLPPTTKVIWRSVACKRLEKPGIEPRTHGLQGK